MCTKLWGDDIINSLIWIFIRTGQEMFSEKMWNFKMSQLPYFLSDFHHFCTNLQGNFYAFFWNYGDSGLDFPFKSFKWQMRTQNQGDCEWKKNISGLWYAKCCAWNVILTCFRMQKPRSKLASNSFTNAITNKIIFPCETLLVKCGHSNIKKVYCQVCVVKSYAIWYIPRVWWFLNSQTSFTNYAITNNIIFPCETLLWS